MCLLEFSLAAPSLSCLSLNVPFFSAFSPVPPTSSLGFHTLVCPLDTASSVSKDFYTHTHTQKSAFALRASDELWASRGWKNRPTEQFKREVLVLK